MEGEPIEPTTSIPRRPMNRSISVPLNTRMGLLKHPRPIISRTQTEESGNVGNVATGSSSSPTSSSPEASFSTGRRRKPMRASTLSNNDSVDEGEETPVADLAHWTLDTVQLSIAHLLHVIPPHLLDPSHESLSATSVSMPVTTVEALMEAYRSINWMCNAAVEKDLQRSRAESLRTDRSKSSLASPPEVDEVAGNLEAMRLSTDSLPADSATSDEQTPQARQRPQANRTTFDLYELMQRAADVVAGRAEDKDLHLGILINSSHNGAEASLDDCLHAIAEGDEGAVRYVLIHVSRRRGRASTCYRLTDLNIFPSLTPFQTLSRLVDLAPAHSSIEIAFQNSTKGKQKEGRRKPCSFEVRLTLPASYQDPDDSFFMSPDEIVLDLAQAEWIVRQDMSQSGVLTAQLIFANMTLAEEEGQGQHLKAGRLLAPDVSERQRFLPRLTLAEEPTIEELCTFASESLKGKKVAFHSRTASPFATHLAQLLEVAGCQVDRIPLTTHQSGATGDDSGSEPPATRTAIALSEGRPAFVRYSTGLAHQGDNTTEVETSHTAMLDPVTGVPVPLPDPRVTTVVAGSDIERTSSAESADMAREGSTDTVKNDEERTVSDVEAFSYVVVDDDIDTLQMELLRLESALPILRGAVGSAGSPIRRSFRNRPQDSPAGTTPPSMSSSRKSPMPSLDMSGSLQSFPQTALTHAIVYFTSLKNFRSVRDVVQPIMESALQAIGSRSERSLPGIIVIPKPAGARRILTALHTAANKPVVDPFFAPLATSPMSPLLWEAQAQLSSDTTPSTPASAPRRSSRNSPLRQTPTMARERPPKLKDLPRADPASLLAPTAASSRSTSRADEQPLGEALAPLPPAAGTSPTPASTAPSVSIQSTSGSTSPMPAEALEYFTETAARMGGSGASGMMIQSPDGRAAGIFFHPKHASSSSSRITSTRRSSAGGQGSGKAAKEASAQSAASNASSPGHGRSQSLAEPMLSHGGAASAGPVDLNSLRRSSNSSIHSTTSSATRATNWADAPSGTIFSPEIGIQHVLASGKLPLATPIGPGANLDGAGLTLPARSPATSAGTPSSGGQPSAASNSKDTSETAAAASAKQPTTTTDAVKDSKPRRGSNTLQVDVATANEAQGAAKQQRGSPADPIATTPSLAAPVSFQATAATSRPVAQAQSGLLIGAGFSTNARRGGAPRRATVREKVLPPIKVLIVEDNPINQRILKQFMTRKKIKFEVAGNGREAVDKWQTGGFHLILMDIQLPVMDGIEATKEIRKQESSANVGVLPGTPPVTSAFSSAIDFPSSNGGKTSGEDSHHHSTPHSATFAKDNIIPATPFRASVIIVALTASVLNSDRVAALAAGCNDFLNKPVSLPWLEKKIIEWGSMQYILLSGAGVFDAERRAQRYKQGSQGAAAAAAVNSDLALAFGRGPDVQAKMLASRLHLPTGRRAGGGGSSPGKGGGAGAGSTLARRAVSGGGSGLNSGGGTTSGTMTPETGGESTAEEELVAQ